MAESYLLPDGAFPVQYHPGDLDAPYWEGTKRGELRIQRCRSCQRFQWGPEYLCHRCHSFDLSFDAVTPRGVVYSWQRSWHPSHPQLREHVPYVTVVVELDEAPGIRVIGNLVRSDEARVGIGAQVVGVFEPHAEYTLLHWRLV